MKITRLLAVSGGADSMALLHMMRNDPGIMVAHVNHMLRPDSHLDANLVNAFCIEHNIPFVTTCLTNPPKTGIEAWARTQRYSYFECVMLLKNIPTLVTAHNANDQAETIIMRIIRGTGIKGLRGIHEMNPALSRPLLHMTKNEIYSYCQTNNVPYREDSTNKDLIYFRNRVRHTILDKSDIPRLCHIASLAERVFPKLIDAAIQRNSVFIKILPNQIHINTDIKFDDLTYMHLSEICSDYFPLTASIFDKIQSHKPCDKKFDISINVVCDKKTEGIIKLIRTI